MVAVMQAAMRSLAALAGLALAAAPVFGGCSAYDSERLPESDRRSMGARGGSGGSGGAGGRSGAGGTAGLGSGGTGDVTVVGCGDGTVAANEVCDTAIATGMTGACPTSCPALTMGTACVTRELIGTACQAECVEVPGTCTHGDGCCPESCTAGTDDDCSASCGNGMVDVNETCEPVVGDAGVDAGASCPRSAEDCDDDDPCTVESVLGSAQNCNAECLSTERTQPADGDGCCPTGANSVADDDCPPECGNDIVEGEEECDGSDGCDGECKITYTAEQQSCLAMYAPMGSSIEECAKCACVQCTALVETCRGDADTARRGKCDALINCALANDCNGNDCYCGKDWETNDPLCIAPTGDCIAETQAAASNTGTPETNPITILGRQSDTNYALGRAIALGQCTGIPMMSCSACPQ
jgi:hypothetical protein